MGRERDQRGGKDRRHRSRGFLRQRLGGGLLPGRDRVEVGLEGGLIGFTRGQRVQHLRVDRGERRDLGETLHRVQGSIRVPPPNC